MIDQLQTRAEAIKDLLRKNTERGADLLFDFAQRFSGGLKVKLFDELTEQENEILIEDVIIIKKLDWKDAVTEREKKSIIASLIELVDTILINYDPETLKAFQKREKEIQDAATRVKKENGIVLSANNLEKQYLSSKFTLKVSHLEIRLGEITGLVGENATGKTTLFRILAGELAADKGKVNYPIFESTEKGNWPQIKSKIAYVPQELPPWNGSLRENLQFEAALHGIKGAENSAATDYIIQRLGLALYKDKSWAELSGGYKLRFALAKALIWRAQLLIIDEPLAFLDIKTQLVVLNDLKNLSKSLRNPIGIILSSQHLHEVEAVADQMLFLKNGTMENLGKTTDFNKKRDLNLFEVQTLIPFSEFQRRFEHFSHYRIWSNGMTYFVSTPLKITGDDLLQFLQQEKIQINYYRDISCSVKTRFYLEDPH